MEKKKIVAGVLIMIVGALLLLNQIGLFNYWCPGIDIFRIVISWQSLLIAIGIILLFDRHSDHKTAGLILIVVGLFFIVPKIYHPFNMSGFIIPIAFIVLGIVFIIRSSTKKYDKEQYETWCNGNSWKKHYTDFEKNVTTNWGGVVRKDYAFSNSKEKWTQSKLKNLEIEAVFSGVELDFTQTELADDIKVAAHIKIKSVFSGVVLYVPEDWNIMVQKTGVFGGFTDNRPNRVLQITTDKLVVLELEAVFGGGEIRCYE